MSALTKKQQDIEKQFDFKVIYPVGEALEIIKKSSYVRFNASVDIAVSLNIDPKKTDQVVKGSLVLPHGTGKNVTVAVICNKENGDKAKNANADFIGNDDIIEKIISNNFPKFDILITEPSLMPKVMSKIGRIIGPKGLMPSLVNNTVTTDIATSVKEAKMGRIKFKTDKYGIVHSSVGKVSFLSSNLQENIKELVTILLSLKPSSAKNPYIKKISLSSTMGRGVFVSVSSVAK